MLVQFSRGFWSVRYFGSFCVHPFSSVWRQCSDMMCGSDGVVINRVASWRTARSALGCLSTTSRFWVSGRFTLWVPSLHLWRCCQTLFVPFDNTVHSYLLPRFQLTSASVSITAGSIAETACLAPRRRVSHCSWLRWRPACGSGTPSVFLIFYVFWKNTL